MNGDDLRITVIVALLLIILMRLTFFPSDAPQTFECQRTEDAKISICEAVDD